METSRRGFLGRILAAGVAPAFVGSGILMPVKKIWQPQYVFEQTSVPLTINVPDYEVLSATDYKYVEKPIDFATILAQVFRERHHEILDNVTRNNSLLVKVKRDFNYSGYTIEI